MADKFSKKQRLLKSSEFQELFKRSDAFYTKRLRVQWATNDCEYSRLGLSVSKKVGNSVQRNKIKRILRESFRKSEILNALKLDLNIMIKRTQTLTPASLTQEFEYAIEKISHKSKYLA